MWAHELEGKTIIIETCPDRQGKRRPVGYMWQVRLEESGLIVPNVVAVKISPNPIVPNCVVTAEITLIHYNRHASTLEIVSVEAPKLAFAAHVQKEIHE